MSREFDFVIFGASGFTGRNCVVQAPKLLRGFRWAVAGRSRDLLEAVLLETGVKIGENLRSIPIILADVYDKESLTALTARCRVLVNCCGPYLLFGEPVVEACLETSTDYVDVCAEPQFMDKISKQHHEKARQQKVFCVSACGFDSIPCELGLIYAEKHFKGTIHSAEIFIKIRHKGPLIGVSVNYGTWLSMIHVFSRRTNTQDKEFLFPDPQLHRKIVHKSPITQKWYVPFPNIDERVSRRTQRHFYDTQRKHPIQIREYYDTGRTCFLSLVMVFWGCLLFLITRCTLGVKLLLKYPRFFSGGQVSKEGPTSARYETATFEHTFHSVGWSEGEKPTGNPTHSLVTQVRGQNPAYGATCKCLLLSALTLVKERDRIPESGGVWTPGVVFRETQLLGNLQSNGVEFHVTQQVKRLE